MANQLTPEQQQQLDAFVQSPQFLSLPEGRARYNAYIDFTNSLGGNGQNLGNGGFFQSIAGQSDGETLATRILGSAVLAPVAAGVIGGGALGAAAVGSGTAALAKGSQQGEGGGSSLGQTVGDFSQVAGDSAAAAAHGRLSQAQVQNDYDRNAINLYNDTFQNNLKAPSTLASQAARGDVLANVQPASFSGLPSYVHMPQMQGGLTPAALGPGGRSAGQALTRNAILQLGSNKFSLPQAPSLTPLPPASGAERALGTAGTLGALASPFLNLVGHGGGSAPSQSGTSYGAPAMLPGTGSGYFDQQGNWVTPGDPQYYPQPAESPVDPTQLPGYTQGGY